MERIIKKPREPDFETLYSLIYLYDVLGKRVKLRATQDISICIIHQGRTALFEAKRGQVFPIFLLGDQCLSVAFILLHEGFIEVLDNQVKIELKIPIPPKRQNEA